MPLSSQISIRPARTLEFPVFHGLWVEAADDLDRRFGAGSWSAVSLPRAVWRAVIGGGRCFFIEQNGMRIGAFGLTLRRPFFYREEWFSLQGERAAYLHSMCLRPPYQRRGIGRMALSRIEELATGMGAKSVRLDVGINPADTGAFYTKCGYEKAQELTVNGFRLACYEKRLCR